MDSDIEIPHEIFIDLHDQYREGRVVVNFDRNEFYCEVDIVQIESQKIWMHIGILYHFDSPRDAMDAGVQFLSDALKNMSAK